MFQHKSPLWFADMFCVRVTCLFDFYFDSREYIVFWEKLLCLYWLRIFVQDCQAFSRLRLRFSFSGRSRRRRRRRRELKAWDRVSSSCVTTSSSHFILRNFLFTTTTLLQTISWEWMRRRLQRAYMSMEKVKRVKEIRSNGNKKKARRKHANEEELQKEYRRTNRPSLSPFFLRDDNDWLGWCFTERWW